MEDVAAWRRARRAELTARRRALDSDSRAQASAAISTHLAALLAERKAGVLGLYWPIRGEFDPRPLAPGLIASGWRLALPVVAEKRAPLIFRSWTPTSPMERGVWGIPVPKEGAALRPAAVLAPLVGFDAAKYRLGNGGGYFDRTLATLAPKPYAIGVGFELGRLPTIHPRAHDMAMDAIVTEAGVIR